MDMPSVTSRLQSVLSQISSRVSPISYPLPKPRPVYSHALSPTSFLPRAAAIEPSAIAIHHTSTRGTHLRRTYLEFANRARGLAYFLRKYGYKCVGILAPNTPAFLESIFGIGAAGSVQVGINYRLRPEELAYIFTFAEVDCMIVDSEYVPLLKEFKKQNPQVPFIIDTDIGPVLGETASPFDKAILEGLEWDSKTGGKGWDGLNIYDIDDDTCLAIPFTSGTTSRPKGVIYTHRGAYLAALANVIESGLAFEQGKRCGYLWTLPLFHAAGWTFPWAVTAVRGTHYCLRRVDYAIIWKLLKSGEITHFNAAPTVNTFICASKEASHLSSPVHVTLAGSPPTANLLEQMTQLNLMPTHVYGMTETYGPTCKSYFKPEWHRISSKEKYAHMAQQGHGFITSLPIRIIKTNQTEGILIDVEKDGREVGELVFSGNICAKGYLKDVEATKTLWAGGVLHSGDLAVWHSDGSVQIVDRKKDIIISGWPPINGGENISSIAVESMLAQHPDVLESAVVGVPDSNWGERVLAFVVCKEASNCSVNAVPTLKTGQQLLEWAKNESSISRFMIPREIIIVDQLPKTSSGKVKKNVLRQWAVGDYSVL